MKKNIWESSLCMDQNLRIKSLFFADNINNQATAIEEIWAHGLTRYFLLLLHFFQLSLLLHMLITITRERTGMLESILGIQSIFLHAPSIKRDLHFFTVYLFRLRLCTSLLKSSKSNSVFSQTDSALKSSSPLYVYAISLKLRLLSQWKVAILYVEKKCLSILFLEMFLTCIQFQSDAHFQSQK